MGDIKFDKKKKKKWEKSKEERGAERFADCAEDCAEGFCIRVCTFMESGEEEVGGVERRVKDSEKIVGR